MAIVPPLVALRDARLKKAEALRERGLNPYPSRSMRTEFARPILENFESMENQPVTVAGRLISWRKQGGMAFGHIQDQTGSIQLVFRRATLHPTDAAAGFLGYEDVALLDVGDVIEVRGPVGKTMKGEISVMAETLRMLTKSLRPLPEKWSGLKDRETILRKRYLDTIADPGKLELFARISRMIFEARQFLYSRGFLEFQTPVIQPLYGGGTAKPFLTHVNALGSEMYLAISHELYLKRLIAAGYEKVFTIGRYFRNEGIDRSHHPEFSMIETMTAYQNYEYNMALVEDLFRHVAVKAFEKTTFLVRGHEVDFAQPWKRISMVDATRDATGIDFSELRSVEEANARLRDLGVTEEQTSIGAALVRAFEAKVEDTLIQPTLVYGHPIEISPLAKPMAEDPRYVERFEIFIAGMECGDNWSEQNDPEQLFKTWQSAFKPEDRDSGEFHPMDYDFLEAMDHGIPPTTGIGPGIERMAMIFTEQQDIYDVIFFPMMKPVLSQANKAIYGVAGEAAEEEPIEG